MSESEKVGNLRGRVKYLVIFRINNMTKAILLVLPILPAFFSVEANSQQKSGVFVQAEPIETSLNYGSYYPGGEANMGRTGRVLMSLMIDEKGKAFSPLVLVSNNSRFHRAAKKMVLSGEFEPATLNGEPITSSMIFVAVFELDLMSLFYRKSNKKYHEHLENFNAEISSSQPDSKILKKLLKKMAGTTHGNNFIQPVISRAKYEYVSKFGADEEKIAAIRELLLSSTFGSAVTQGMPAQFELIKLLINANHYGEALYTYDQALNNFNPKYQQVLRDSFGDAIHEILEIRGSDKAYGRDIEINDDGYTYLPLFKRSFTFSKVEGALKELKFRCEKQYKEVPFQPDSDFQVPAAWGDCLLEIIGKRGSKAFLIQQ